MMKDVNMKNVKKNDLLVFMEEHGEENENLYLVTSVMESGIKTINLVTGGNKTIFYKNVEGYKNIGQVAENLLISKKI